MPYNAEDRPSSKATRAGSSVSNSAISVAPDALLAPHVPVPTAPTALVPHAADDAMDVDLQNRTSEKS